MQPSYVAEQFAPLHEYDCSCISVKDHCFFAPAQKKN